MLNRILKELRFFSIILTTVVIIYIILITFLNAYSGDILTLAQKAQYEIVMKRAFFTLSGAILLTFFAHISFLHTNEKKDDRVNK